MGSHPAADFSGLLARLSRNLERAGISFMVIGGQAVLLHGLPRLTEDVDLTLGTTPEELDRVLGACQSAGLQALPDNVVDFVRDTYVLPLRDQSTGIRADLIFSSTLYEREAIARAVRVPLANVMVPFAAAEDLVIHKLFANRPRDWEDATGVVRRRPDLDWAYIERWAREFAGIEGREGMPGLVAKLRTGAQG